MFCFPRVGGSTYSADILSNQISEHILSAMLSYFLGEMK